MDYVQYNGWTNYATWLCNLWFDNFDFTEEVEEGHYDGMNNAELRVVISNYIQEYVEEFIECETANCGGFISDMIRSSMNDIDYIDIADHYTDDIIEALKVRGEAENIYAVVG